MPNDQLEPTLNPEPATPWLARNRKLIILSGLVIILVVAALVVVLRPRQKSILIVPGGTTNDVTADVTTNINQNPRPTFQRSTIVNTSTAVPPAYTPPTKQMLQQNIDKLKAQTTTK